MPDDIVVAQAVHHSAATWAAFWQDANFKKHSKTWWKSEGIVGVLKADNQLSDFWITQVAENTTTKLENLVANHAVATIPHLIFSYYTTKDGVYFTLIDDCLISCKSEQAMKNWLDKIIADQVLAKLPLDDTNSPLLYVNLPILFQFFQFDRNSNRLDNSFLSSIFFGKLTYKGKLADLQGKFIPPATTTPLPEIQWKYELQAPALTSPMRAGDRIFVQDEEKRLYCLSLNGDLIWMRELESKLLSPILMVGQTYFFNTANFIYQTDLSGNDASNSPHRLQSPASNGLTLVDFDQMQAYNYFLACENGNIYGYELPSFPLLGWNPQVIGQIIQHPIKHFQIPEKDFIVAASEKHYLFFSEMALCVGNHIK
ncbi:MAG: PQQ-binding-like beta-propeller repeat protein [Saprospiraceae bacterium]|nr:PQQ-binding-like beta-propeller repeat protein [Saprospiraceae bacterium]